VVVLGYVGLILLFAWPLPANLTDSIVLERGSDAYQHLWNLWWMRFSLLTLHSNPYYTSYLNFPTGQPLTYHVLDPLDGLLSIPFQPLLGLVPTFNVLRLGQLLFAALAAYALCRLLRLPRPAAFAGGALFAFCPLVGSSFDFGQLVEISVGWLPLFIFCLIKALGNRALGIPPGARWWLLWAGLALAGSALSTWYFFTALILFAALYVAWECVGILWPRTFAPNQLTTSGESNPRLRPALFTVSRAALIGLVAGILLSPLLIAVLRENATGADYTVTPFATIVKNSADLLSFFLPLSSHLKSAEINSHGANPALGWLPMLLAALGLFAGIKLLPSPHASPLTPTRPRRFSIHPHLLFWLAAFLLFALLALGPHLLIAGTDTALPMPYLLLNKLPFIGAARVPLRFTLLVSLSLAILAGFGLLALWRFLSRTRYRPFVLSMLGILLIIELFGIPRTLITPTIDPFFSTIRAQGSEGSSDAVLELPYDPTIPLAMYDQAEHQHPILGAYTSRHYPYPWIRAVPGVAHLTQFGTLTLRATDIITPQARDTALPALDYYGVRYVVVRPLGEEGLDRKIGLTLETIFEAHHIDPVYQDTTITAYKVPPQPQTGPIVGLGDGWYLPQQSGLRQWRATNGQATVLVTNPLTATMPLSLTITAFTEGPPRHLTLRLDGNDIAAQTFGPAQTLSLPLDLAPGEHWLELLSPEDPYYLPDDPRPYSVSVEQITFTRR
jgi:hypothetical protein